MLRTLLLLALFLLPAAASAQSLRVGERLRTTTEAGVVTGWLVQQAGDTLLIGLNLPGEPARSVALADLDRLERRYYPSRWKGAALGAGVGLAVTGVLAAVVSLDCGPGCLVHPGLFVAGILGPPLVASGALIGVMAAAPRWRDVPVGPIRADVSVVPAGAGVRVSLVW
jgi:hypothetical protein